MRPFRAGRGRGGRGAKRGILVDALHFDRSDTTLEDVRQLPHRGCIMPNCAMRPPISIPLTKG
jgi:hypothetical protein